MEFCVNGYVTVGALATLDRTVPLLLRPHLRLKWRCRRPRWGSQFSLIRCTLMSYDMYFTVENTTVAFRPVHKLAVVVVRKRLPSLPRLVLSSPPSSFLVLSSPTRLVFLFSARTARHARSVPQAQLTYLPPSLSASPSFAHGAPSSTKPDRRRRRCPAEPLRAHVWVS